MRVFTNLRLLRYRKQRLVDHPAAQRSLPLLLWFSLSDVSSKAQHNQQQSTMAMRKLTAFSNNWN